MHSPIAQPAGHPIAPDRRPVVRTDELLPEHGFRTPPPVQGPARRAATIAVLVLLGGLTMPSGPVLAAQAVETFGPGRVSCQPLVGAQMDCLLAATRITDARNVVSFDVGLLPARDQALFRRWCLAGTDACTVTVTGRRASPQSTRLGVVTSVRWSRLSEPGNDAAARAAEPAPPVVR